MARKTESWQALFLIAVLAMFSQSARAEDVRTRVPKFEFLNDGAEFSQADSLYIKIRNFDKSRHPNLRARLFWGTREGLPKDYYKAVNGPGGAGDLCFIYDSVVLPIRVLRLGVNLGRVPRTGRQWVVVFEEGNLGDQAIKISQAAVGEYFKRGYKFSLAPPPKSTSFLLLAFLSPFSRFSPQQPAATTAPPGPTIPPATLRPAVDIAARKDEGCIRFRSLDGDIAIAEMGPCSECGQPRSEVAGLSGWLTNISAGLFR